MNSNKIQQLLKVDPLRPPVKHEKNKASMSSLSKKSQTPNPNKIRSPVSPLSTKKASQRLQSKKSIEKDNFDIGDEKVTINIPQMNIGGGDKESPYFRSYYSSSNNKSPISQYAQKENIQQINTFSNKVNQIMKTSEHRPYFVQKANIQLYSEDSSEKENMSSTLNQNDDSYSGPYLNKLAPSSKRADQPFTFESDDILDSDFNDEIKTPTKGSVENKKNTVGDLTKSPFETSKSNIKSKSSSIYSRRQSQNIPRAYQTPTHHRIISENCLDQYVKNKKIDPSGNKSHLLTPEKSTIEERYNHHSANKFYFDVLKELEKTPLELEEDGQVFALLSKASKSDQTAYGIVQSKFGENYSQALYHIFNKYQIDSETNKNKLTYGRFLNFAKDFGLLNNQITKEIVSIIYARRCPNKNIDFAAFIDILFKMSKQQNFEKESKSSSEAKFRLYLDKNVLNKHQELLNQQQQNKGPRLSEVQELQGKEEIAINILKRNNQLLNHIFTLYETFDIQYHSKSVMLFKDFKRFCYDYSLVPIYCTLHETIEIFKRFQINNKPLVDFHGFVLTLISFACIGLERNNLKEKNDSFAIKLNQFFGVLSEMNSRLCDQLVTKHVNKPIKQ